MRKFIPVSNVNNTVGFKFKDSTSITEGYLCTFATGADNSYVYAEKASVKALTDYTNTTILATYQARAAKYFPVYFEDPDDTATGGTIAQNDYIIGFFGDEYKIHSDASQCAAASYSVGDMVCLASTGKHVVEDGTTSTNLVIGICLGTTAEGNGDAWIHIRRK